MQNHVSIYEHQTRPNPALAAVHGQAAMLLRYDVPTYYASRELLAVALRTELPDDMVFEAILFLFDALVFMLPNGTAQRALQRRPKPSRERRERKYSVRGLRWPQPVQVFVLGIVTFVSRLALKKNRRACSGIEQHRQGRRQR
jgi:hypothetical protein